MNELSEIYNRDKKTISEFLDNNHDLPSAVKEALLLQLAALGNFLKMLDETEVKNNSSEGKDSHNNGSEGTRRISA
jgi:hypothetical protein